MSTRCSTCSPPASDSRNLNLPASGTVAVRMLPRALVPAWGATPDPASRLTRRFRRQGRASANDREQPRSRSSRFRHGHGPHAPAGKPPGAGRLRLRSASDPRSEPVPPWSGNSRDFHRGLRPPPRLTSVAGHSVPEISGNSSLRDNQALAPTPKARNAAYPTDQAPLCLISDPESIIPTYGIQDPCIRHRCYSGRITAVTYARILTRLSPTPGRVLCLLCVSAHTGDRPARNPATRFERQRSQAHDQR